MEFREQGDRPQRETVADVASLPAAMANTLGDLIDSIAGIARMEASLAAAKAELVDQARQWSELTTSSTSASSSAGWSPSVVARREFVSELACALRIPERTAETLIADSEALQHELSATFAALSSGEISWRHARVIIDQARTLPEQARAGFEESLLPAASTLTVAQFERKARKQRERLHPESITERHAKAVDDRFVECQPAEDGMAWISALLPAADAVGIYNRLTDMAMHNQNPDEQRTLSQMRADLFGELLLDGKLHADRTTSGIRPRVLITVPALALMDQSDEPAVLEGYGPIDIETAKELTVLAPSFTRLLTHPETGAVLSIGRDRYTPTAEIRTWLRVRDGTCRFPGCNRGARRCDLDHTLDHQYGGDTAHYNLAHLCPAHHHLKHQTGWTVKQLDGGVIQWTSPHGKVYTTQPEVRMEPAPSSSP